jgi:transmembrane sensor
MAARGADGHGRMAAPELKRCDDAGPPRLTPDPMTKRITKELIFSYLAGKATALQKQQLDTWASQPENGEQFYAWLDEWERTHAEYLADVEPHLAAFRTFTTTRQRSGPEFEAVLLRPVHRRNWVRWAAAGVVLALLAAGAWHQRDAWYYEVYRTTYNQTRTFRLPDGSQVVLNANSLLRRVRHHWGKGTRQVYLEGEAAFSVVHTSSQQPFIVRTAHQLEVVVLGTEFSVFARPRVSKVALQRGRVRLAYRGDGGPRQLTLKPGDVMTLDAAGRARLQITPHPDVHTAWKSQRVVFEETSLAEIRSLFSENYGLQLEIPDTATARRTLSGAFTASDADELLRTVTDALGMGYRREGTVVYLTP